MRSITALLATSIALVAQDPAIESTRTEAALAALDPRFAYAAAIVPLEGEATLMVAGHIDERTPFATWHLVPLGKATRFFLDVALARAIADGALSLTDEVLRFDHGPALTLGGLAEFFNLTTWPRLPSYERFAFDATGFRPPAEVVAAHAFAVEHFLYDTGSSTLQVALAQQFLERRTERSWSEWLTLAARELRVPSAIDLTRSAPASGVAFGRCDDATPFPVRLTEIPAAGNAACAAGDLVPLVRSLLRGDVPRGRKRFFESWRPRFGLFTHLFEHSGCGATLRIEMLPEDRTAIVVFGSRTDGEWVRALVDALLGDLLDSAPEPGPDFEYRVAGPRPWKPGALAALHRGTIAIDGRSIAIEIGPDGPAAAVVDPGSGAPTEVTRGSLLHGSVGFEATIPIPQAAGADTSIALRVAGVDRTRAGGALDAAAWLERKTRDGILVELLPQRVTLQRAKDD